MPALPYRITISEEDFAYLKSLIKTRTIQSQVVDRARILLWKSEAKTDKAIADGLGISVNTVRRCVDRYLNSGIDLAIFDDERPRLHTECFCACLNAQHTGRQGDNTKFRSCCAYVAKAHPCRRRTYDSHQ